jgi:hypothetical protein
MVLGSGIAEERKAGLCAFIMFNPPIEQYFKVNILMSLMWDFPVSF